MARAGDNSLHRHWLSGGPRNFDLFLSCYGKDPSRHEGTAEHIRPMGSTKWPALHDHIRAEPGLAAAYEAIWFPDDDILADAPTISRMFETFSLFGMALAQPALTAESHHTHPIVLRHPAYVLRRTNFVEVMAPILDARALALLVPTFAQARVGWGLDYLWPVILERAGLREAIGIIDAAPVTHTRAVGGGDIYLGMNQGGESDIRNLRQLYPDVEFCTRRVVRRFAVLGGVRIESGSSLFLARMRARTHQWLARRRASREARFDPASLSRPIPSSKADPQGGSEG